MKKFLNNPERFVDDMMDGLLAAHSDQWKIVEDDKRCVVRAKTGGKVALVSGGGSGHLPLFVGYVGEGMLDGCAVGGVFQSPAAEQWFTTAKAASDGKGVLFLYGNYTGDIMNCEMAREMLDMEDIPSAQVLGNDDVASAPKGEEQKRRGVAGIFFVYKCAGAKAEEGAGLDEVRAVAEKTAANVRTMGVALSACIIPEIGTPGFDIADGDMEIGMGIHGEPGIRRGKLAPADAVVDEMLAPILADNPLAAGDEAAVLINGLGGTPREELYIINKRIAEVLGERGVEVVKTYAGEFATSMEMAGFSISVLKLDAELKDLLARPCCTPFFEQRQLSL